MRKNIEGSIRKQYETYDERLLAWKRNRVVYKAWRKEFGAEWVEAKRKSQLNLCFICLEPLDTAINVDHIFPLYLGGTNSSRNLCITHPKCNMDKGAKLTMDYNQACRRRKLFNDLRLGKLAKDKKERNPKYKLYPKHIKRIKLYRRLTS